MKNLRKNYIEKKFTLIGKFYTEEELPPAGKVVSSHLSL